MGALSRSSRGVLAGAASLLVLWVFRFSAGPGLCWLVAARLGGALERLGRGKFNDPAAFLLGRGQEALLLLTVALALAALVGGADRLLGRAAWYRGMRGVGLGVLAFAAVNGWVAFAAGTALFWMPFFNAAAIDNVVQYEIKRNLLPELRAQHKAVLLGNSQTRAAIKEEILNDRLLPRLWTTELHQPGCNGFGTLLLAEDLRRRRFDFALFYVSEIFVYGRENGAVIPHFLHGHDLLFAAQHHGLAFLSPEGLGVGLAGVVLPLVRYRDSFAQRVLGGPLANLPQVQFDTARPPSLEEQARGFGNYLRPTPASDFQKRGFEQTVTELAQRGCTSLVIAGGVHPALRRAVAPEVRADMASWLRQLGATHARPGAVIIPEEAFFEGTENDYDDLVHLSEKAQERFTIALAGYLETSGLLGAPTP